MKRWIDGYYRLLQLLLTFLMSLMLLPVMLQIASRFTGWVPRYIWTEEVARFCFVWLIMIGSMVAVRDETHFVVDLMPRAKSAREQGIAKLIVHLAMAALALVFSWYGFHFARFGAIQASEMSGINMATIYASFPLAGASWILFLGEKIVADVQQIRSSVKSEAP